MSDHVDSALALGSHSLKRQHTGSMKLNRQPSSVAKNTAADETCTFQQPDDLSTHVLEFLPASFQQKQSEAQQKSAQVLVRKSETSWLGSLAWFKEKPTKGFILASGYGIRGSISFVLVAVVGHLMYPTLLLIPFIPMIFATIATGKSLGVSWFVGRQIIKGSTIAAFWSYVIFVAYNTFLKQWQVAIIMFFLSLFYVYWLPPQQLIVKRFVPGMLSIMLLISLTTPGIASTDQGRRFPWQVLLGNVVAILLSCGVMYLPLPFPAFSHLSITINYRQCLHHSSDTFSLLLGAFVSNNTVQSTYFRGLAQEELSKVTSTLTPLKAQLPMLGYEEIFGVGLFRRFTTMVVGSSFAFGTSMNRLKQHMPVVDALVLELQSLSYALRSINFSHNSLDSQIRQYLIEAFQQLNLAQITYIDEVVAHTTDDNKRVIAAGQQLSAAVDQLIHVYRLARQNLFYAGRPVFGEKDDMNGTMHPHKHTATDIDISSETISINNFSIFSIISCCHELLKLGSDEQLHCVKHTFVGHTMRIVESYIVELYGEVKTMISPQYWRQQLKPRWFDLRESLKFSGAITIASIFQLLPNTYTLYSPYSWYAAITVAFSYSPDLGASWENMWGRLVGTVWGCIVGYAVVLVYPGTAAENIGYSSPLYYPRMALLIVWTFCCNYVRWGMAVPYPAILCQLSAILIALGFNQQFGSINDFLRARVEQTIFGILILLAVVLLIWPNTAQTNLRKEMINGFKLSSSAMQSAISHYQNLYKTSQAQGSEPNSHLQSPDVNLRNLQQLVTQCQQSITQQRTLMANAQNDPPSPVWGAQFQSRPFSAMIDIQSTQLMFLASLRTSLGVIANPTAPRHEQTAAEAVKFLSSLELLQQSLESTMQHICSVIDVGCRVPRESILELGQRITQLKQQHETLIAQFIRAAEDIHGTHAQLDQNPANGHNDLNGSTSQPTKPSAHNYSSINPWFVMEDVSKQPLDAGICLNQFVYACTAYSGEVLQLCQQTRILNVAEAGD